MVKENKNTARFCHTTAADKKRKIGKTCFCVIVHLFREFVMGAAFLLAMLALFTLCEALSGGGLLCWLVCALCVVSCNWCCGLLLPVVESEVQNNA